MRPRLLAWSFLSTVLPRLSEAGYGSTEAVLRWTDETGYPLLVLPSHALPTDTAPPGGDFAPRASLFERNEAACPRMAMMLITASLSCGKEQSTHCHPGVGSRANVPCSDKSRAPPPPPLPNVPCGAFVSSRLPLSWLELWSACDLC